MTRRLIFILFAVAIAASSGATLGGCNQKTPDVANSLLSDTITMLGFSCNPVEVGSAYRRFAQFNDGSIFLGKGGVTEAVSFARFIDIPDTLGSLTDQDVVSASLILQPQRYALGDTVQNRLKISVVELLRPFLDTTKADQITPDYFDSKVIASIDAQIPLQDSVAPIEVPFDKNVVIKWLQRRQQFKNDSLTWGVAFRDNGSTVLRRFSTATLLNPDTPQPMLRIALRKTGSAAPDTMIWQSGNNATFTYAALGDANSLTVHGSVAINGTAAFDLQALPAGAAIHLAKLTLTLDPTRSIVGNFGVDSIIGARFIDSSNASYPARDYFAYRVAGTQKYIFPTVNSAIDGMLRRGGKGVISIRPESSFDLRQCNRLVFFGADAADTAARPRLEIIYSKRPKLQP